MEKINKLIFKKHNMNELFYNAVALMHTSKNKEMEADLNKILKSNWNLSVNALLNMSGTDFVKTNANEVMWSEQTGFGKEWVEEVVLSSELLERIWNANSLLSKVNIKTMLANAVDMPIKGARVRMIWTSQATDKPFNVADAQIKKLATPTIRLEANEFVITIYYSDTLLEDSVLDIANYVVDEIFTAYENSLHQLIINGDTETGTTNINYDWAAISGLPDGASTDFLKSDGARKVAISNSATVDAGANLDLSVVRSARSKMGIKWVNPSDLVMVVEQNTYFDLMNLTEVETMEKFGDAATVKNGRLVSIDWMEIMNREELKLATATWVVSSTAGNNTLWQIVIIHIPSLLVGFRRALTTELSRWPETRLTGVTGSTRFAVKFNNTQNNDRATSPVALITNI